MSSFPLFPEQASTVAMQVDLLYFALVALSVLFCAIVFGLVVLFSIQYRRRSEDERPKEIHGHIVLELVLLIVPFFLSLGVFTAGADVFFRISRMPNDPLDVYVVGKQWMWKIQHEQGKREINTLHVPVDQTVRLTMTSEDVLHNFFIPAFRVKKDVIPGRYTTMWFEATKVGEYHLFCAEYCGTQHSGMIGQVIVMDPTAYDDWLSGGGSGETMVQAGERKFQEFACHTCHKTAGDGRGPSLVGLFGTETELTNGTKVLVDGDYLRDSILNSQANVKVGYQPIMPLFQGQISEESLLQIIAYIKSLSAAE